MIAANAWMHRPGGFVLRGGRAAERRAVGAFTSAYGLADHGAVLVRPDGHVASAQTRAPRGAIRTAAGRGLL